MLAYDNPGWDAWRDAMVRCAAPKAAIQDTVAEILHEVQWRGDEAVAEFTKKFDGVELKSFRLREKSIQPQPDVVQALEFAHQNILRFSRRQMPTSWQSRNDEGAQVGEIYRPFDRVGIYVPGGSAPLVSTALMTVTLAAAARCPEIVVVTPPPVNKTLQFAVLMAGATEIYQIGGAQAVGALAFGTKEIRRVQKILGPGNAYVTEAKRQVLGYVSIDQLPGPSEVMVIADSAANPAFVASDLLAQAEHGPSSSAMLLSTSRVLRDKVRDQIEIQLATLSRREILAESLEAACSLAVVRDIREAIEIANDYAPEHLSLQVHNPRALLPEIVSAGAIFLGGFSPVAAGDFVAGPSHTLPTGGAAKSFSGLTAGDFFRRTSVIEYSPSSLKRATTAIQRFAAIEGLDAHGRSATIRFER